MINLSRIFKNDDISLSKLLLPEKSSGLILCAKDHLFHFNDEIWLQIDGNSMGSLCVLLWLIFMSHIEEECINNDMFSVFINHLEKTDMSYRNPVPFSVQGLNYQYIIDEKNYKICSLTMQKVHMKNKISFLTKRVGYYTTTEVS